MSNEKAPSWLDEVRWDAQGLIPAIAQEEGSGDVLMVAWMNRESLAQTVQRGEAVYWSRSRQKLWHKGEESGHVQRVHDIHLDCDADVLLLRVTQLGHNPGVACHTGRHSCFYKRLGDQGWEDAAPVLKSPQQIYGRSEASGTVSASPAVQGSAAAHDILSALGRLVQERRDAGDPSQSYVAKLFDKGLDHILKKVGEEATEVVIAAKGGEAEQLVYEVADLWFHSIVALAALQQKPEAVLAELARREGLSGLVEFAQRQRPAKT
ncbi:bifunctional phosphoribosyl-AMP cyclohydrolase/phosphoribosyl-ATP diphosphatase HisIE [Roseateles sp. BYS180W]|uniref:Histidine biosynthesis bifunctional protein HisIE n=1 Tax=Roseateles rivi TaxID=3299028 RepID=A0ABW7FW35_9BURK